MTEFAAYDTSNYTTSCAIAAGGEVIVNERIMLEVAEGGRGLRQSDAVFAHTVNLPLIAKLVGAHSPAAVGCSYAPRDADGSYMPCFLPGVAAASAVAGMLGIPLYRFSHQAGHVMAALYGSGRMELSDSDFTAFHISGGTTELLHVSKGVIERLGGTIDISAGKAIDRIGVSMGMKFPCGKELEALAGNAEKYKTKIKPCVNGCDCNLSGLENIAAGMLADGISRGTVAMYTLDFIAETVTALTSNALKLYPGLPVICAGGVMSNKRIRSAVESRFDAYFAPPELSCDNAAGIALLTEAMYEKEQR